MSDFKVKFTLKQHTPIIHFQSDQRGATLRATELKPKFDRFLLEHAEGIPFKKNANGHRSLEYKVKIEHDISSREEINDKDPLFFGNMKPREIPEAEWLLLKKRFKFNPNRLKIEFLSYSPEVKKAIEKYFASFLVLTNFGTRQSKGFGGFYIANEQFDTSCIPYRVYSFKTKNWKKDIGLLYQFLRQGINLPRPNNPFYTKPAIFAYAKSKGWQWDKKSVKQEYFSTKLEDDIAEHGSDVLTFSSEEQYLLRDLFGLSSTQEWKSYGKTIEKETKNIDRFMSPLTFKIIDDEVHFWANSSIEKILNKEFTIKAGRGNDTLKLSTPSHFSFDDFFDFTFNKLDIDKHISPRFHDENEFKIISRIVNNIKVSS